jgi:dihydrofolate reductase
MTLSIIVAISTNNVIGTDNQLPWHLPADLQYFKSLTVDHPILMGRKTYDSIGRPLPKRTNIVITRDQSFHHDGLQIAHSIDEAIDFCKAKNYYEVFIIGGDTIYNQTIHLADKLYITRVDTHIEKGTAFFPLIDMNQFKLISSEERKSDEKNTMDMIFEVYEKASIH